ncbi:MAG: RnfABCDGE type electron transport complex subunit G [Bacillota bacterium]
MRDIIRLVLVLGLVGFISGGALGAFYEYTAPIVKARQMQEIMEKGLKGVFPDAESFQEMDSAPAEVSGTLYKAFGSGGKLLGIVFETVAKEGFAGNIGLVIGIDPESQKVIAVKVMGHQETPGLGSKIEEPSFIDQFKGKSILDNFQVGQDIDGITGATVSVKAVAKAVGLQSRAVLKHLGQDVGELPPPVEEPPADEPAEIDLTVLAGELWPGMGSLQLTAVEAPAAFSAEEEVYQVKTEKGENLGLLLVVEGKGYGGPMKVAVGIDKDLTKVTGVRLLENKETPGLGTKVGEEPFVGQFTGKSLKDTFALGQDIDAVTMATVSSQGVVDVVREKARAAAEHYKAGIDTSKALPQQKPAATEPAKEPAPKPASTPASKEPAKEQPAPQKPSGDQVPTGVQHTVAQELWSGKGKLTVSALEGAPNGFTAEDKAYLVKTEKGDTLGVLLLVYGKGYGGPMQIAIALDNGLKSIVGVKLLENKETPGLGTKVGEAAFTGQFVGKQVSSNLTIGQDLDGITMATVSAEAFANTVREKAKAAADYYRGRLGS